MRHSIRERLKELLRSEEEIRKENLEHFRNKFVYHWEQLDSTNQSQITFDGQVTTVTVNQNATLNQSQIKVLKLLEEHHIAALERDAKGNIKKCCFAVAQIKNNNLFSFLEGCKNLTAGQELIGDLFRNNPQFEEFYQQLQKEDQKRIAKEKEEEEKKKAAVMSAGSGASGTVISHEFDPTPTVTSLAKGGTALLLLEFFGCSIFAWALAFAFLYAVRDVGNQQASSGQAPDNQTNAQQFLQNFQNQMGSSSRSSSAAAGSSNNPTANNATTLPRANATPLDTPGLEPESPGNKPTEEASAPELPTSVNATPVATPVATNHATPNPVPAAPSATNPSQQVKQT